MLLSLLFPSRCSACGEDSPAVLCPTCVSHLVLLSPGGRCRRCFGNPSPHECIRAGLLRQAFCFEASPISQALEKKALLKLLVSYLVVQLSQLDFAPDVITTIPLHPLRRLTSEALHERHLADALAHQLSLPRKDFLTALTDDTFAPKFRRKLTGESLLLVGFRRSPVTHQAIRALKNIGPCHVLGLYIISPT